MLAAAACTAALPLAAHEIRPESIAAHVEVLASDAYEGRAPGTAGETRTVAYIGAAFRAAGLKPVAGDDYRLPVALIASVPRSGRIVAGALTIGNGDTSVVRAARDKAIVEADAVFAGYGISAVEEGRDDFAGLDLAGKIAVVFSGPPPEGEAAGERVRAQWSRAAKLRNARRAGARAVVVIYDMADDDPAWRAVRDVAVREQTQIEGLSQDAMPLVAVMNRDAGARVAAALGTEFAALKADAGSTPFRGRALGRMTVAAENGITRFPSANVAGVLPGTTHADEYIVYLAHWDHFGRCAASGDTICNGAVDNASGVGGLIELAMAYGHGKRPARSVVFLATTAEERGLLGGRHFAGAGPIPAARMVAAFGLDTIAASGPTKDVVILGRGLSNLDRWIRRAARSHGRRIVEMPGVQGFFGRSDHFAFAEAGVPAVIASGGFAAGGTFQDYMREHYHKPSDDVSRAIDYRGAAADVALILDAGRGLANSREWPSWAKSSPHQRGRASQP